MDMMIIVEECFKSHKLRCNVHYVFQIWNTNPVVVPEFNVVILENIGSWWESKQTKFFQSYKRCKIYAFNESISWVSKQIAWKNWPP